MRVLVVDDEPLARTTICSVLRQASSNVKQIQEASGVASAKRTLAREMFDLVLLDIQMRDGTAFDLLRTIPSLDFKLVFITAHDQYALQAFQFAAMDYVLKPIDRVHLNNTIERVYSIVEKESQQAQLSALLSHMDEGKKPIKMVLKSTDEIVFVDLQDIEYLEADINYTQVVLSSGEQVLQSRTLKEFEKMLENQGFYRIHRSYLINVNRLTSVSRSGKYVKMKSGTKLPMSSLKKEWLIRSLNVTG